MSTLPLYFFAFVQFKGTKESVVTDLNGHFALPKAKRGEVMMIKYIGMETQTLMGNPSSGNTGFSFHKDLLNAWSETNTGSDIPRILSLVVYLYI